MQQRHCCRSCKCHPPRTHLPCRTAARVVVLVPPMIPVLARTTKQMSNSPSRVHVQQWKVYVPSCSGSILPNQVEMNDHRRWIWVFHIFHIFHIFHCCLFLFSPASRYSSFVEPLGPNQVTFRHCLPSHHCLCLVLFLWHVELLESVYVLVFFPSGSCHCFQN